MFVGLFGWFLFIPILILDGISVVGQAYWLSW
jgi:hypothetical protein